MAVAVVRGPASGKDAAVWLAGLDFSADYTDAKATSETDALDETGMGGSAWRTMERAGPGGWTATLDAIYRRRAAAGDALESADHFRAAVGSDPDAPLIALLLGATAGRGGAFLGRRYQVQSAAVEAPRDDLITLGCELTGSDGAWDGWVLVGRTSPDAAAASADLPSIDLGSELGSGARTMRLAVHVEEASAGAAVRLYHSADDSAFAPALPELAVAGRGAYWIEGAVATPGRYWRLRATKNAGDALTLGAAIA